MNHPATTTPGGEALPLGDFSQCHVGILSQLGQLGSLPGMIETAVRAREIAQETIDFFHDAVFTHHREEEKDLFPIVAAKAVPGEEQDTVRRLVDQLTAQHRDLEAQWRQLEPQLRHFLKGHGAVDTAAVQRLVQEYQQHARLEEAEFLPLSERILGRESADMAELGLALHTRRVVRAARRGLRGS